MASRATKVFVLLLMSFLLAIGLGCDVAEEEEGDGTRDVQKGGGSQPLQPENYPLRAKVINCKKGVKPYAEYGIHQSNKEIGIVHINVLDCNKVPTLAKTMDGIIADLKPMTVHKTDCSAANHQMDFQLTPDSEGLRRQVSGWIVLPDSTTLCDGYRTSGSLDTLTGWKLMR